MDTTVDSTVTDDYDEPIWKSKANRSTYEKVSYSKQNANKFLDKNKADDNRELFLDLFHEDPNELTCNEKEFEKDLFADIQSQENDPNVTKTGKRKKTTKKKNNENPDFLSDQYQRNLVKQKDKLQELFEKTPVYQSLKALKDKPLNIEEVDCSGNVTRRFEYYFDYEKDKHDIIEIKNDKSGNSKRKETDESEDDAVEDVLKSNQKINKNGSLKRKRSSTKLSDKSATKSAKKSANKSMNKSVNKKSKGDKSISKTTNNKATPKSASKSKRKSIDEDVHSDQNQRPSRKRAKVNYSES